MTSSRARQGQVERIGWFSTGRSTIHRDDADAARFSAIFSDLLRAKTAFQRRRVGMSSGMRNAARLRSQWLLIGCDFKVNNLSASACN